MRRLPPFPELIAFEAVARHHSFTKAAEELCLTQSAVSHRIRRLESYLGTQLIRRLNPGLELTETGMALLPELTAALDALARLGLSNERCLRVVAGTALCHWWLAGRLTDFMAQHPGISVELIPRDAPDANLTDIDLWVGWVDSGKAYSNATQAPLFSELVFPVCSPSLLAGGVDVIELKELSKLPLLHKASHAIGEWSWSLWFERLGIDMYMGGEAELRFADSGLLMSAAVNGAGVALARSLLAYDALQRGTLVVPIAEFEPMQSLKKHVARWAENKQDDPDVDAFVRWLVTEAAQALAGTESLIRKKIGDSDRLNL